MRNEEMVAPDIPKQGTSAYAGTDGLRAKGRGGRSMRAGINKENEVGGSCAHIEGFRGGNTSATSHTHLMIGVSCFDVDGEK